jgi:hypothetical protein
MCCDYTVMLINRYKSCPAPGLPGAGLFLSLSCTAGTMFMACLPVKLRKTPYRIPVTFLLCSHMRR